MPGDGRLDYAVSILKKPIAHCISGVDSSPSLDLQHKILATTAMAAGFTPIVACAPRILSGSLLRYLACHAEGRKLLADEAEARVFVARPPRNAFAMKSLTSEDPQIRPSPRCRPLVLSCLLVRSHRPGVSESRDYLDCWAYYLDYSGYSNAGC